MRTSLIAQRLLDEAENDEECLRLLAVSTKESGACLRALPVSALGLRVDNDMVRVAVGRRLGVPVCRPHHCQHCSAEVNALGRHAHVRCRLEPTGFLSSDGKRPAGVTLAP